MSDVGQQSELVQVADRVHSAALHLVRTVRTADAAMGLSPARASAMSVLVFGGPMSIGALAAVEGVQSPTMTQLVNGLERSGFVRRRPGTGDRRQVVVEATDAGRALLHQGRARRVELLRTLLVDLDEDDLVVLDRAAELMERAVARHQSEPPDRVVPTPRSGDREQGGPSGR
jgi:DNA-binding MarR family transcriptional regulator